MKKFLISSCTYQLKKKKSFGISHNFSHYRNNRLAFLKNVSTYTGFMEDVFQSQCSQLLCSGCIYLTVFSITSHSLFRRLWHLGSLFLLIRKATIFCISLYFLMFPCCLINIDTLRLSGSDVENLSTWLQLTEMKQTGPLTEKNMHALKNLMSSSAKEHCINFRQEPYFSNIFGAQNLLEDTIDNTSQSFLQFLSLFIMRQKPGCFVLFS